MKTAIITLVIIGILAGLGSLKTVEKVTEKRDARLEAVYNW